METGNLSYHQLKLSNTSSPYNNMGGNNLLKSYLGAVPVNAWNSAFAKNLYSFGPYLNYYYLNLWIIPFGTRLLHLCLSPLIHTLPQPSAYHLTYTIITLDQTLPTLHIYCLALLTLIYDNRSHTMFFIHHRKWPGLPHQNCTRVVTLYPLYPGIGPEY